MKSAVMRKRELLYSCQGRETVNVFFEKEPVVLMWLNHVCFMTDVLWDARIIALG